MNFDFKNGWKNEFNKIRPIVGLILGIVFSITFEKSSFDIFVLFWIPNKPRQFKDDSATL